MATTDKPLISPILWLFMGASVLAAIAEAMARPLLPLYVQELGADITTVGLFFTLSMAAPIAFQILGGWISDTVGRLQATAIGSIGGMIAFLVFILAPSWEWLLIAQVGGAMSGAFIGPSFVAFIAQQSSEDTRGRVYGITEQMMKVVMIVGPLAGGYLAQYVSFRVMFMVGGALYGIAMVIRLWMARQERGQQVDDEREPLRLGNLKSSLGSMFAYVLAGGVITWIFINDSIGDVLNQLSEPFVPLYLENVLSLSLVQIGWLMTISGIVMLLTVRLGGWLSDRYGEGRVIAASYVLGLLGFSYFVVADSFVTMALDFIIFALSAAIRLPAMNALISKAVPQHLMGVAFGLLWSAMSILALPIPWVAGMLWDGFGPTTPYIVAGVLLLFQIPIAWFKFRLSDIDS